jgi:hypothetical protein
MLQWKHGSTIELSVAVGLTENGDFFRIVLLSATIFGWRDAEVRAEDLSQVRLAGEATICRNVNNAYFPPFQKGSSMVDSALD